MAFLNRDCVAHVATFLGARNAKELSLVSKFMHTALKAQLAQRDLKLRLRWIDSIFLYGVVVQEWLRVSTLVPDAWYETSNNVLAIYGVDSYPRFSILGVYYDMNNISPRLELDGLVIIVSTYSYSSCNMPLAEAREIMIKAADRLVLPPSHWPSWYSLIKRMKQDVVVLREKLR